MCWYVVGVSIVHYEYKYPSTLAVSIDRSIDPIRFVFFVVFVKKA